MLFSQKLKKKSIQLKEQTIIVCAPGQQVILAAQVSKILPCLAELEV